MKVLFFDLETTGTLVNRHGIHQISGAIVVDGEVKEEFDFKVQPNPKAEITQEALEVAGVTKEQILSYPPMGTIFPQFIAMLDKYVDRFNKKDKFFWQDITTLLLIINFCVHGSFKTEISILVPGSGVTV